MKTTQLVSVLGDGLRVGDPAIRGSACLGHRIEERQTNRKGGPLAIPLTRSGYASAVYLNDMASDCQPQSEPSMLARSCAISLANTVKREGQKFRANPTTRVSDSDLHLCSQLVKAYPYSPTARRKLHSVRN